MSEGSNCCGIQGVENLAFYFSFSLLPRKDIRSSLSTRLPEFLWEWMSEMCHAAQGKGMKESTIPWDRQSRDFRQ